MPEGQDAIHGPDGYMVEKLKCDMDKTKDKEKDAQMLLMEEISNRISKEDTQDGEHEMFDVDVETAMNTTILRPQWKPP